MSDPKAAVLESETAASEGMMFWPFSWDSTSQEAQGSLCEVSCLFFGTKLVSARPESGTHSKPRFLERYLRGV